MVSFAVYADTKCFEGRFQVAMNLGSLPKGSYNNLYGSYATDLCCQKNAPGESNWRGLFALQCQTSTQLSTRDFLNRLNFKNRF